MMLKEGWLRVVVGAGPVLGGPQCSPLLVENTKMPRW